ncbi:MAG: methionyl-tRNA formyltransferase [Rhodospirillales bacterium]|nr:methionyl-tRNA formyltransferase [Rhodospirillales bacterium]
MSALRIIFMGTPDFSVPVLDALIKAGHNVICAYSQPPKPVGRGHKTRPTPIHAFAEEKGIEVRHPKSLKSDEEKQAFMDLKADIAVVVAYGLILPKAILEAPRLGCVNIHASLLPRWRGAAPIQRAILAGDSESGVTIMQMDEGLDTGDMLMTETVPLTPLTTASELHDNLSQIGAKLIIEAVSGLDEGRLIGMPQPEEGVTYAAKLEKNEGRLDWSKPAIELQRAINAFTPWPGATFAYGDNRIKVLEAEVVDENGTPGTVLDDTLTIACGEKSLRPLRVQRPGKGPMDTEAMLRGFPIAPGTVLS